MWDEKDCMEKASKHLCDESVCREVTENLLIDISKEIKLALNNMLYDKEVDRIVINLYVIEPQLERSYLLPKILNQRYAVPGRCIVVNGGTGTKRLSEFVHFHFKQIIPAILMLIGRYTRFLELYYQNQKHPQRHNSYLFQCCRIICKHSTCG